MRHSHLTHVGVGRMGKEEEKDSKCQSKLKEKELFGYFWSISGNQLNPKAGK